MRKFNIKMIIMAIAFALLISISVITFAAFSYHKGIVSADVTVGDIIINNKSFVTYAKKDENAENEYTQEFYRLCKLRTDSVAIVEGITINSSYQKVNISSFSTGVTYYTYDSLALSYVVATNYVSGTDYYIKTDSLSIKTAYDADNNLLSYTTSNNVVTLRNGSTIVEILTLTIENGVVVSVGLNDSNHRCVIGSNGLSIYIFTNEIGTSRTLDATDTITCYASERKRDDSRIDYNLPYLNQLGLAFEFTAKIPVYLRVHIQDAWISTQFLSSKSVRERYVSKDQISGSSPFSVTDNDWYYDEATNIAYYKGMFEPIKDTNGDFKSQQFIFNVNEGYFYYDTSAQAASKVTTVQVSFTVELVQANRAEELWGVDFDELFGN